MTAAPERRPLEPLPADAFESVLCVVAHPDDMEYGPSAAVAAWTARGVRVSYLLLTAGEAGMQVPPAEVGPLRSGEQRAACAEVGVDDLVILDFPDGVLVYSLELRKAIARRIRQVRPDAVLIGNYDVEAPWGLNQADHRVAGLATLDAVRDADNTWVFPELATDEGLPKWGTKWLLVAQDGRPTHAVDVTGEPLQRAIASLGAHREYLASLGGHPPVEEFIPMLASFAGPALGVEHAIAFRVHDLRPGRPAGG